ncbi:PREDICTED: E3 ubiquitin-protein ligase SH3RF1-like [Branchiostoma belcheri]|uniref:RING-type E3 ubiquitin transferase n=1 Tax=Branchiostoma belcheri TaxID=7741 RepID=A0A6P5AYI2_BRABE|nr:PREDICTED: E3 ubiquitin-protein ligase SH3RF1-like [Branchiostoma belcheri]
MMDEKVLEDLLECSVCLGRLTTNSKVLPCQHTFCKRCLEQIVRSKNELRCPECRILVTCSVDELPSNILLVRLLDGIKERRRTATASQERSPKSSHGGQGGKGATGDAGAAAQAQKTPATSRGSPVKTNTPHPCAKALYSYEAEEPGDLSFNKGDIIALRQRIDENWYQGELNGQFGFFPVSYVEVIHPLPPDQPTGKAKYKFDVTDNEEDKDCLTFEKDEIVTVIRRVDENWAEGMIGDKIGIFPISFVEMNEAAKSLIDRKSKSRNESTDAEPNIQAPARTDSQSPEDSPSSSAASGSQANSSSNHDSKSKKDKAKRHSFTLLTTSNKASHPQSNHRHSMEISAPVLISSSNPTAAARIDSNTLSSSAPSSSSPPTTQVRTLAHLSHTWHTPGTQVRTLAHLSLTCQTPTCMTQVRALAHLSHTCHTGKKLSTPVTHLSHTCHTPVTQGAEAAAAVATSQTEPAATLGTATNLQANGPTRKSTAEPSSPTIVPSQGPSNVCVARHLHKPQHIRYVAKYSYKPQKSDELELKKADIYLVCEKMQDGWFKGTSLRTGQMGMFPGNYVQPLTRAVTSTTPTRSTSSAPARPASSAPPTRPTSSTPSSRTTPSASGRPASSSTSKSAGGPPPQIVVTASNAASQQVLVVKTSTGTSRVPVPVSPPAQMQSSHPHRSSVPVSRVPQQPGNPAGAVQSSRPASSTCVIHGKTTVAQARALAQPQNRTVAHMRGMNGAHHPQVVTVPNAQVPPQQQQPPRHHVNVRPMVPGQVLMRPVAAVPPQPQTRTVPVQAVQPQAMRHGGARVLVQPSPNPRQAHSQHGGASLQNTPTPHAPTSAAATVTPPNMTAMPDVVANAGRSSPEGATGGVAAPPRPERKDKKEEDRRKGGFIRRLSGATAKKKTSKSGSPPPDCTPPPSPGATAAVPQDAQQLLGAQGGDPAQVAHGRSGSLPVDTDGQHSPEIHHHKSASLDSGVGPSPLAAIGNNNGGAAAAAVPTTPNRRPQTAPLVRERFRAVVPYPPQGDAELELKVGDIVYVHKKREDGWFKGTLQRTGKTGLFPGSFVESF